MWVTHSTSTAESRPSTTQAAIIQRMMALFRQCKARVCCTANAYSLHHRVHPCNNTAFTVGNHQLLRLGLIFSSAQLPRHLAEGTIGRPFAKDIHTAFADDQSGRPFPFGLCRCTASPRVLDPQFNCPLICFYTHCHFNST
jgi:hypothetical protein